MAELLALLPLGLVLLPRVDAPEVALVVGRPAVGAPEVGLLQAVEAEAAHLEAAGAGEEEAGRVGPLPALVADGADVVHRDWSGERSRSQSRWPGRWASWPPRSAGARPGWALRWRLSRLAGGCSGPRTGPG